MVITTVGAAEAGKIKAVGTAEADVIKLKIDSMESGNYALVQVAQALASNNIKLVPDILVAGGRGEDGRGGTLVDVMLANVIRDQQAKAAGGGSGTAKGAAAAPAGRAAQRRP